MSDTIEQRIEWAATAGKEETTHFAHDPSPWVIKALLSNRNLSEQDVLAIANRKNLPGDVLEIIAKDVRWAESYQIRLALSKNPKMPLFVSLKIAQGLRLLDLAELSRSRCLPIAYRHKLEAIIIERMPTMALGLKTSLAKMADGNVLFKLIEDGISEVVKLCLNNPHLVEATLYKVINRLQTMPGIIKMIAEHPNWSSRYVVRMALIRNRHTPLARCVFFLPDLKTRDLHDLYADPSVSTGVKPYIHRELWERGETAGKTEDEEKIVYEIGDETYEVEVKGSSAEDDDDDEKKIP